MISVSTVCDRSIRQGPRKPIKLVIAHFARDKPERFLAMPGQEPRPIGHSDDDIGIVHLAPGLIMEGVIPGDRERYIHIQSPVLPIRRGQKPGAVAVAFIERGYRIVSHAEINAKRTESQAWAYIFKGHNACICDRKSNYRQRGNIKWP